MGRATLLRKVASNVETKIKVLGASGIEDKLQQGLPEAIESLRTAGIKVWVLTGDKQETAISIGYSSKLLSSNMTQIIINLNSKESCRKSLEDALSMSTKMMPDSVNGSDAVRTPGAVNVQLALIIDGTSLVYVLDNELEEQLFQLPSKCSVVLCCHVAPLQKARIVALVKRRNADMTLAIGDVSGANDVSMIQMADVGVGISGQEGRQAVMASDFSMGQFRFFIPLLLVHGHWDYQRMAYMIIYNFYGNAVFVFLMFWFTLFTAFTLTTAITEWSSMLYSVLYTVFPTFWITMADTLYQTVVVYFIPLFVYRNTTVDISSLGDLWTIAVVIVVNLHLAMDVIWWSWVTHAGIWGSIIATCSCVMTIDSIPFLFGYRAIFVISKTSLFWALLLIIVVAALTPRFVVKVLHQHCYLNDIRIAREAEKFGNFRQVEQSELGMNSAMETQRR